MIYKLEFSQLAKADIAFLKKNDSNSFKKLSKLLIELSDHPTRGTGKPERLKDNLSGKWSRRINRKDRLIYIIDEDNRIINILSARGHYDL